MKKIAKMCIIFLKDTVVNDLTKIVTVVPNPINNETFGR